MNERTRVLLALVLAIVGGIAIAISGSASLLRAADFIAPIGTLWINAIRMTVIPLVVSLLITGVASASDIKSVGRLGARTLFVFFLLLIVTAVIVMPVCVGVFNLLPQRGAAPPLPAGAAEAAGQIAGGQRQTFAEWVVSLLPSNPIAAAATGNMVPLILFTLLFAIAVASSGERTRATLVGFFQALGDAILTLVRWVIMLAPIGIFALLLPLAAHAGAALAGAIGFFIVAYSAALLAVIILIAIVVPLVARISIRQYVRAALPAHLVAFSSSSSIASLPALVESAERGLSIPKRVSGFVLPLAVSMFHIAAPVSWTAGALFVAWFYAIPLHASQFAIIAFAAVFLTFAAPGIPRGAFLMLAPLFIAIGLPVEGVGILIAVDAIPDTFATTLNVAGDLAAVTLVAAQEGRQRPSDLEPKSPA
jgi:proton glutamate symport protein